MNGLRQRWRNDCRTYASSASREAAQEVGADLLARWAEPHRWYHGEVHLLEVRAAIADLARSMRPDADTRGAAVFAAWFHDAIYSTSDPAGNERASADLAAVALPRLGVPPRQVERVCALIMDTRDHLVPDGRLDPAAPVLHDADLWILAAPVSRFDEYCAQVRREYADVPSETYARARTAVLRPFLTRPHVYATARARQRWEGPARENLAREISRLGA